jgi:hypothetical protein
MVTVSAISPETICSVTAQACPSAGFSAAKRLRSDRFAPPSIAVHHAREARRTPSSSALASRILAARRTAPRIRGTEIRNTRMPQSAIRLSESPLSIRAIGGLVTCKHR